MIRYEKTVALWKKKKVYSNVELAEALSGFRIDFAYHSGKIENDRITYDAVRKIFEDESVFSYSGDLRTLFEMRNSKDAFALFLSAFSTRRPLDERLIKDLQFQLTKNTYDRRRLELRERPGEYKKHDYVVGRAEVGAAPEEVEEEISELLSELVDFLKEKVLTVAAYFHAKFEEIHAFADGNGRTGRLAMNYLLLLHDHPPVIIHEEDREKYYAALEEWEEREELAPLIKFLKEQVAKTWAQLI